MDILSYNAVVGSTAEEFADTGLDPSQLFTWQIGKQNAMYSLPINDQPTLEGLGESPVSRMQGFMKTLKKEMDEGAEILALLKVRDQRALQETLFTATSLAEALRSEGVDEKRIDPILETITTAVDARPEGVSVDEEFDRQILVMLSDWLGDMQVYNRSEAMKFGIPLEAVLMCIMGSNFTKLGADGEVLKDANGKVQKGPNFVPPEAHIYATLFGQDELLADYQQRVQELDALSTLAIPALHNPTAEAVDALFEVDDLEGEEEDGNDEAEYDDA